MKATVRPWLAPALRSLGLRQPPTMKVPPVSRHERLREEDVPTRVSVRADETLLVNGQPFFPIGVYNAHAEIQDRSGAGLARLRTMGFNTVLLDCSLDLGTLDRIAGAGMLVVYRPPGQLHGAFVALKEIVSRVARHPALLAWEMDDEPILNNLPFADVRTGCDLVRRIDRFHPIFCNQWLPAANRIREVRHWAALADVYGFGVYPIPIERWRQRQPGGVSLPHSMAMVGAQVALWRTLAPGKPVIPALQAFAWNALEDGDAGFPAAAESRFMAYHSVISGAKGLHHYGVPSATVPCLSCGVPPTVHTDLNRTHEDYLRTRDANERFWARYHEVIEELAAMSEIFTAPDGHGVVVQAPAHLHWRVKAVSGSLVLMAVNASETATQLSVRLPIQSGRPLQVWGESRTIEVDSEGRFQEPVEPFGVLIISDLPDRPRRASGGA